VPDERTQLLVRVSRLPIFAGVPPSALAAAAERLEPVPVTAGTVVVRQGDRADRFYLIETGTFAVDRRDGPTEGGTRRLRELGPDEVFGELGLLDQAPRSATVTAETDGQLLALSGPDFLELVGAAGELSTRLRDRYRGAGTAT
jgi:CRP-like cAMP-binding protein